jgi:hypothetical protein
MRISDTEDGFTHRMPAHFMAWKVDPAGGNVPVDDTTTLEIGFWTDMQELRAFVPEEFEIIEPVVKIMYQKLCGVSFMGGSGYSLVLVGVPARYAGPEGSIDGLYVLVIWEDNTTPILGGREEAGIPKIFADIPEYHRLGTSLSVHASHEGRAFLEIDLIEERPLTDEEIGSLNADNGRIAQFGWRYIPKVGPFPGAALSEATYYPIDTRTFSGSRCTGSLKWTVPKPVQHPMQVPIIDALARLPVREYLPGSFRKGTCLMRMDLAHALPGKVKE